jgi:hypothetical protein
MRRNRLLIDAGLRGNTRNPRGGEVLATVSESVAANDGDELSAGTIRTIKSAIEPQTGWRLAKDKGITAVPRGEASAAAEALIASLSEAGVFVVPSGAVESFVPGIGGKSGEWLSEVVAQGLVSSADGAKSFVGGVLGSFATD